MMSEEVSKYGIYFDEIYTLRVLEPNIASETNDLTDECSGYTEINELPELDDFRKISEQFIQLTESFVKQVDIEKMKAIGAQNALKTTTKQRETEHQELQTQLLERSLELERLKIQYQYLQRIEAEQQDVIKNLYQAQ